MAKAIVVFEFCNLFDNHLFGSNIDLYRHFARHTFQTLSESFIKKSSWKHYNCFKNQSSRGQMYHTVKQMVAQFFVLHMEFLNSAVE